MTTQTLEERIADYKNNNYQHEYEQIEAGLSIIKDQEAEVIRLRGQVDSAVDFVREIRSAVSYPMKVAVDAFLADYPLPELPTN